MNPTIRNILVTIVGLFIGSIVNMQIIMNSGSIIPLPDGVDPMNMTPEVIGALPLKNFIPIFLAHALGTFSAAFIACRMAASQYQRITIIIGVFFLLGGIAASFIIKPPIWYIVVDLLFAYLPFALLGKKLVAK